MSEDSLDESSDRDKELEEHKKKLVEQKGDVRDKLLELQRATFSELDAVREVARMTNFLSAVGVEAARFSEKGKTGMKV